MKNYSASLILLTYIYMSDKIILNLYILLNEAPTAETAENVMNFFQVWKSILGML